MGTKKVHKLRRRKHGNLLRYTYCGVNAYRRGVMAKWPTCADPVTCKECLAQEARENSGK